MKLLVLLETERHLDKAFQFMNDNEAVKSGYVGFYLLAKNTITANRSSIITNIVEKQPIIL
jgi:hypothetical protein